jgi:hypothetical protein
MTGRKFAIVNCSHFESPKLDILSSNDVRMVLFVAHCSRQNNAIGLFHFPLELWVKLARVELDTLKEAISELREAGLIEYDFDRNLVSILGWFQNKPPNNPKEASGIISVFREQLDTSPMMVRQIAEFCAILAMKMKRWSENNSDDFRRLVWRLSVFMCEAEEDSDDQLTHQIVQYLTSLPPSYRNAVKSLGVKYDLPYPSLTISNQKWLEQGPQDKPLETVSIQREERREKEKNRKEKGKPVGLGDGQPSRTNEVTKPIGELVAPYVRTKESLLAQKAREDMKKYDRNEGEH